MERVNLKNRKIIELENRLNDGGEKVLDEFWKYIKSTGNPLIEEIEGNSDESLVTIVYREKKKVDNVVLIPPVGMRKLENCVLDKVENTDLWYISYKVKNDICFNYQFVPNDPLNNDWNRRWNNVEGDEFNKVGLDYIDNITGRKRKIPFVVMKNADKRKYILKDLNSSEGKLERHIIYSEILNEDRNVTVYLPHNYENDGKQYGMVLLNDGFEYLNILNATNVFDNLISRSEIPPVIGVFVESTKDRADDLKCNDDYLKFICDEVVDFIKSKYNVSDDQSKSVIVGYSLGGLFASYAGLRHSEIFGNVLSQSGSYWYKRDDYKSTEEESNKIWMSSEFEKNERLPLKFYINVGKIEPKVSMIDTNVQFKNDLIDMGYDVQFEYFCSGHDYWYWGETLKNGLGYLIGNK
ncbi:MAG: alpha/beta hydrolase-fold protein [Clostridium sp.]|nr:alpha/beta hydrolase-fold protein [Clostridium sp.]